VNDVTSLQRFAESFDCSAISSHPTPVWFVRSSRTAAAAASRDATGSRSFVDIRGSLALPAALHDGCPLPGPSSRDDVAAPAPARRQMRTDPPDLDSTSEYSSNALVQRPSLVGFVRVAGPIGPDDAPFAPPSTSRGASTPARRIRRTSVPRRQPRNRVPSSWFCTTSTVSAAPCSRACCIPLPILGFATFPASAARTTDRSRSPERTPRFPRRESYPAKE
jgi:hypothetical protein